MQQPISNADVFAPSVSAVVGGREIAVDSVSMDRSLPDPLVSGGLRAASGWITALEGPDVVSRVATPWDPGSVWPPAPETPVSLTADGVSILADGRVVSGVGGTDDRAVSVEVADGYQSLVKSISWDALADAMPSETDGVYPRYVGLRATALTDRILRHCGWFATPPMLPYCSVSVPAMGTMWPERGVCRYSGSEATGSFPGFYTEPWGSGVTDISAEYVPIGSYSVKSRGRIELVAVAGRKNGGTMRLDAVPTGGGTIRLAWTDSTASVWLSNASDVTVSVASLPRNVGDMLYATVARVTDTSVNVTLRVGLASTSATASVKSTVVTDIITAVRINGSGAGGGFQVAFPSTAGDIAAWKPNAVVYERQASANTLYVAPSVEGANCADLLAQQCEAQNATYWIDETGVLRWWDMERLDAQPSVATLTSDDNIDEAGFTWEHSLSQVKSGVAVKWREPLQERSWWPDVDFYQGNGASLQVGTEAQEEWIEPKPDEVWIMPDLSLDRLGSSGTLLEFNRGKGSWYGAVFDDIDSWSASLFMTIEKVTDSAFKLRTQVSSGSSGTIVQKTISQRTASPLWMHRRGMDLPIIRGKAKYTFADRLTMSAQKGPVSAPEHTIDAGFWIQRTDQAQKTADYAGARMTVAQPVLSSVALIPVPGLQIGDVVEVVDTAVTRLTIRGIVLEDSRSIDSGMSVSHSVAIRPTYVSRNGVTFEEWGAVVGGDQYQAWGSRNSAETYDTWGDVPLKNEAVL